MNRIVRLLTGYIMPLLILMMLMFSILIYLQHHGRVLPCYNE